MARKSWKNISIPEELYEEVQRLVPQRARSVQDYVRGWVRVGVMVDGMRERSGELDKALAAFLNELQK